MRWRRGDSGSGAFERKGSLLGNLLSLRHGSPPQAKASRYPCSPKCALLSELHAWAAPRTVLLAVMFCLVFPQSISAQVKKVRRVLIFNELGLWSPGVNAVDKEIFAALMESPYQIEFYSEDLDTSLFPDEATQLQFRESYFRKYKDRKPDLIIAVGPSPIKFMSQAHNAFAPHTPIIFWGSTEEFAGPAKLDPDFTGVWGVAQPDKTLDAALHLKPSTKHVFVVGGVAPYDRYLENLVKQRFRAYESKLDFTYFTDLAMPDLLERLKHLPRNSIVYHTSIMEDAAGTHFIDATQSVPMVASAANAPVFAVDDVDVGRGTVGGDVFSFALGGQTAAEMAIRILNGEDPQKIPIVRGANIYLFDWRALKRWGLDERDLPPGSVVLNRQPTLWESYKWYIIGGVSLIMAQSLMISGLMWQRARLRRVEAERATLLETVQESEQRFRLVANTAPVMIWMSGTDKLCTYFNQPWVDFTGRSLEAELGNGWATGVHPDDLTACLDTYTKAMDRREPFKMQCRLRRSDGEFRWILYIGVPRFNSDRSFAGYIGSAIDVTEQREAAEAIAGVSRRLVEAQEAERTRIARELHDDINQRLALIVVNLKSVQLSFQSSDPGTRRTMDQTSEEISALGNDIQALSRSLHSSSLEYLGLETASAGLCKEFAERHSLKIDFRSEGVPGGLLHEISLCLFRVLQEGLQNSQKHSGSLRIEVALLGELDSVRLIVRDFGKGFDTTNGGRGRGLGITSMTERLRLVGGLLSLDSEPHRGTTILACVPISSALGSTGTVV